MKYLVFILLSILAYSCQMRSVSSGMEEALSQTGNNREELFRVLSHYDNGRDSLKFRAAQFLLENMAGKVYVSGRVVDEYCAFMDSVFRTGNKSEEQLPSIYEQYKIQARYLNEKPIITLDTRTMTDDYLMQNIDEAFAVWNRHLSFNEFCEWILPIVSVKKCQRSGVTYIGSVSNLFCSRTQYGLRGRLVRLSTTN